MSMIAFFGDELRIPRMSEACRKLIVLLAAVFGLQLSAVRAQDPPPPEQKQPKDGQPHHAGPPRGGMIPGNPGTFPRGDREHMDAFKQLPEEERARVRIAFEKAWNKPDVMQARDRLMKANEEYREALHHALEEADSGVVQILEKVKVPMQGGGPSAGRLPDPNDPEFSKKVVTRLGEDLQNWARNEKRDLPAGRLHERVINAPAVRDLVKQLEAATEPQRRLEIAGKLREAYLAGWRAEFGQPREGQPRREGPPDGGKPERRDKPAPPDPGKN